MIDPRISKLAAVLIEHSTKVKKNEKVLIDLIDAPTSIGLALIAAIREKQALPFLNIKNTVLQRQLYLGATKNQYSIMNDCELFKMQKMDAYIGVRGSENIFETSDVPADKLKIVMQELKPTLDHRVNKTKWVILRWPSASFAQQAKMSLEAFEDLFFKVCNFDYKKMLPGMQALKNLMEQTDKVHIKGPGTDLRFSIKGIPSIPCAGEYNVPDGEVFTAPVKTSVEGYITYNAPTVYEGVAFENVYFEFKKGKIVKASSNNTKRLNSILDADVGARYIGEFALGVHPYILHPIQDILFDEKICGSFHFTPGMAYEKADNKNRSQVHWDLVSIQRKDYGGGEIYFDGTLVRKDGLFTLPALKKINPEFLQ